MPDKKKSLELSVNQILLHEYTVNHGPYRQAVFASLIDADLTDQADKLLRVDFQEYLDRYFVG
jgi:hypothetical protein